MISALVLSPSLAAGKSLPRAPEAVARSLGALVRAAVEGILRDVTIIGPEGEDLATLADHAGCEFIETASAQKGLSQGLERMRGDIAFIIEGGYAPPSGFTEEAGDILREAALFRGALLRRAPHSLLTRLAPALARPVGALVAPSALAGAAPRDLADVIRRAKIRRTLNLPALRLV
jgi:hypothetical protein